METNEQAIDSSNVQVPTEPAQESIETTPAVETKTQEPAISGSLLDDANTEGVVDAEGNPDAEADQAKSKEENIEYSDFVLPEGMTLNEGMLDEFKPIAKELNLTQEQAQKLVDLQTKHLKQSEEQALKEFEKLKEAYKQESIKFLGQDYKKELSFAKKAMDSILTPEESKDLKVFLDQSGLGNKKELINFFIKVGKQVSEDSFVEGKEMTKEKSIAEVLFGDVAKNIKK